MSSSIDDVPPLVMPTHTCVGGKTSSAVSWWERDGQGIPLVRVCERCRKEKLAGFNPVVLRTYNAGDVDEPIDEP